MRKATQRKRKRRCCSKVLRMVVEAAETALLKKVVGSLQVMERVMGKVMEKVVEKPLKLLVFTTSIRSLKAILLSLNGRYLTTKPSSKLGVATISRTRRA